ncbi:MAG: hypothetical protein AB8G23_07030 [Myxococcota bacterium]
MSANELMMDEAERCWWERTRSRGALWYMVTKGLLFLAIFPLVGCGVLGWNWDPEIMTEGWIIGLIAGGFVFMRKELRYRYTLVEMGQPLPEGLDE